MVVTVKVVTWEEGGELAQAIRRQVFIEEQGVPPEIEQDGLDPACAHVLAFCGEIAVGTGRLYPIEPNTHRAKIGRLAVLPAYRRQGIGSRLLQELLAEARRQGYQQVYLHAQAGAYSFYLRHGFIAYGEPFVEAGIPHRRMGIILPV
ncbi:MAG TPA: GNAT family N-acetyltransferase [Firmicutes bacterium]|nr:GNAT family N-acetyltransferase [Bacillota bacterium]